MSLSVAIKTGFEGFELDAAFSAERGVVSLFGPSGAGKTTIVKTVAGLHTPREGRIEIAGDVLFDSARGRNMRSHARRLGYVFQDVRLFPHMTVAGNVDFGTRFAPRGAHSMASRSDIIDLMGIAPLLDRRPAALSGGEAQRVGLARALMSAPRGLLLDEPLAALDRDRRLEILPYLERIRDSFALPILHVSHSLTEVIRLATTVVVLDRGRVVATGAPHEILADPTGALGDGGALLKARVVAHHADDGLTELAGATGPLWVPRLADPVGAHIRLRVSAADILIARTAPDGLSALNTIRCEVRSVTGHDDTSCDVVLSAGPERLLARITARSVRALELSPGTPCYAILKSMRVAAEDIGHGD